MTKEQRNATVQTLRAIRDRLDRLVCDAGDPYFDDPLKNVQVALRSICREIDRLNTNQICFREKCFESNKSI